MDNVLYTRYPGDARQRGPVLAWLQAIAYGMHSGELVGTPRGTPVAEIGRREVERNLQVFGAHNPALEPGLVQPAVLREELLTRSGLLLPRPGERAAFYHLSLSIGSINTLFPSLPKYRPVIRRPPTPLSRKYRPVSQPPEPGNYR